jgi:phospholipid/cholesterol/gamma-HCH transport system substrate-binding protein
LAGGGLMNRPEEFQAGIFVVLSILLIALSVFTLGKERQIFSTTESFYAAFKDVKGLKEGAAVRLGGIAIGRVAKINFAQDKGDPLVYVSIEINDRYLDRLRKDTTASISTQGLLGDRFLNLSSGKAAAVLPPQALIDTMEAGEIGDILNTAGQVAENISQLTASLNDILSGFKVDAASDLSITVKNLATLTSAITEGKGLAYELIFSEEKKVSFIESVEKFGLSLTGIMDEIKNGDGLLNKMVFGENGGELIANLSKASSALATLLVIEDNNSGPEKQITDSKLSEIVNNLHKVSESLAGGSGTIGALLIDSKLYDNLVEVTDGARRSFILRSAIREAIEKNKD